MMLIRTRRINKNKGGRKLNESRIAKRGRWPVELQRGEVRWFPASTRLIGLVRANVDKFVLPPAVVRKANWRE